LFLYIFKVGDKNLTLSAEEKRQIAISRVLLKNPPIMVFDEGASAPVLDEIKKRNEVNINQIYIVLVLLILFVFS